MTFLLKPELFSKIYNREFIIGNKCMGAIIREILLIYVVNVLLPEIDYSAFINDIFFQF